MWIFSKAPFQCFYISKLTCHKSIPHVYKDPVIPASPDLHLSPAAIMKELSSYFPKFSAQNHLLSLPSPRGLPPRKAQDYQRHYLIINCIGAIRAEHDDFSRFASTLNQLGLLKSLENSDMEWAKDVKGNVHDMIVEGLQLLSRWTARLWEQCAWKFSCPCKDPVSKPNQATISYSDYEKDYQCFFSIIHLADVHG